MDGAKKNVIWLGMTSFFTDVSSEMILALLPLFMVALGATRATVGLVEGVAEATAAVLKAFSGWFSDRLNVRKPFVLVGYTLATAVKPFIALANTWSQVLAVRFVDRVGKGLRSSPRDALIADSVPAVERGRSFGLQRAMDTAGAVVGTLLASALLFLFSRYTNFSTLMQYRTIFWISVIPGILAVVTVAVFVKEVKAKVRLKDGEKINLAKLGRPFIFFAIVTGIFELANFSYALFILRAADLGVIIALIPIIYLVYNFVYAILAQPLGVLADRVGRKLVLIAGYFIFGLMLLGFGFSEGVWQAWALFVVYGVAMSIIAATPRALVADLVVPEVRGTAYGIYYTIVGLTALPATAIAGFLWDYFGAINGPIIAFSYGAVLALVAAGMMLFLRVPAGEKQA